MPTIAEIIAQSSGLPHEGNAVVDNDVVATYDWGKAGWNPAVKGMVMPPAGWTEVSGYLHGYNIDGKPVLPCNMFVRNMQTWVRNKNTKLWTRVEHQAPGSRLQGAYFTSMAPQYSSGPITFTLQPDGSSMLRSPPANQNGHWWMVPRGTYPANVVDAVVFASEMRIDNPNASLIYGAGVDWYVAGGAPVQGASQAAALLGSFIKLTDKFRWLCCTNLTAAELAVSRPPIIADNAVSPPPPSPPAQAFNEMVLSGKGKPGSPIEVKFDGVDAGGNWRVTIRVPV